MAVDPDLGLMLHVFFFFGSGFSNRRDLLGNQSDGGGSVGGGWFRCWHNDMLRSSMCDCLILFLG